MSLLCHFGSSGKTGTDSPHGFVGNGNASPVFWGQNLGQRFQLACANVHGDATFTFLLLFTDSKHNLESIVDGDLALFGAKLNSFSGHAKAFTSLGVTDDDPGNTKGLQLVRTSLSSVSSISLVDTRVLCSHGNVLAETCKQLWNVDVGDAKSNFDVGRDRTAFIEHLDAVKILVPGSVAFPVSSNQVLAGSVDTGFCARSIGSACLEFGCRDKHSAWSCFDFREKCGEDRTHFVTPY
mmetsp:Transcript_19033/g.53062  ORF Transcript_19033/g.53062 Transcript_19033/m.53062 type:complete len:238 (-) Transcript_19033:88-801(-)